MSKHLSTLRRARGLVASLAAVALGFTGLVAVATSAAATVLLSEHCSDITTAGSNGWSAKVDTAGNPATVSYTAPAGFLVDQYCVKAGQPQNGGGAVIVVVTPPSASVTIDHPTKDSVSHYVVHLVPVPALASAAISVTPAACDRGAVLAYGAISNATFSGTANGTVGPAEYSVTATANSGAEFAGANKTTLVFAGTLPGPNTALCPVDEPSVEISVDQATCAGPNQDTGGSFEYTVTVASDGPARAFQVKNLGDGTGGDAETYYYSDGTTGGPGEIVVFATVQPGATATLSLDGLPAGDYRVVSDGNREVKQFYKRDFTINEIDCTPEPSVEFSHEAVCGEGSVTVTSEGIPASWWYGVKVFADGVLVDSAIKQGPGTDTAVLSLDEDASGGEVVVTYWVHASTEWSLVPDDLDYQATYPVVGDKFRTFTVNTDCLGEAELIPVEIEPPADTAPTCEAEGSVQYANGTGYTWDVNEVDGVVTLTAVAEDGYVIPEAAQSVWVFDLNKLTGDQCFSEQPREVPVDPAVHTAPTCVAGGSLAGVNTEDYVWIRTGPDTAAVMTATAIGEVTLTGQTVYGPYDLTKLTGEVCLSETPVIPQTPVVPTVVVPTAVTPATLAETGFPLLGVLGLAGSFSLVGGGLVNARRLLRKSA